MKPKHFIICLLIASLAAVAGYYAGHQDNSTASSTATPAKASVIYSCSMHPQVRSDKPGNCPFCGMALAPLGELAAAGTPEGTVMLSSNRINVVNVQSAEVRRQPLRRTMQVAGIIEPSDARRRVISAYVDGRVDRLFINFVGAEVAEGAPLASLYSPALLGTIREFVALAGAQSTNGFASLEAEQGRLVAGTTQRLKQLGLAESQIAALPKRDANDILVEILAPLGGTVTARNVYEGQYVKEGDRLFEIADFATMWFLFDAYERDLAWLQIGQAVSVTTPALPGKSFPGKIAFIDPNVSDATRSAKVRVELANPLVESGGVKRRELQNKLYAQGTVAIEVPEVVALPRSAVLSPGGQPFVYLDTGGGNFERRRVALGRAGDEVWEVLSGVQPGERVVTEGNLLLDAQAQLDSGGGSSLASPGSETAPAAGSPALPALTDSRQKAATDFLAALDAVTGALAADNLADFNQNAPKVPLALAAFEASLKEAPAWAALAVKLDSVSQLPSAADLKAARQKFLPLSTAVVEFVKAAWKQPPFNQAHIYGCPMVDRALPGAPKPACWIQLKLPMRNPYFGAEMPDCGVEVTP